jgi:iron complex outermembrane receptor protein
LFTNRVNDGVASVTISSVNADVVQQRENVDQTRIRGVQWDLESRLWRSWQLWAAYMYNDARVRESERPALEGKFLSQVPRHRGSFAMAYQRADGLRLAGTIEATGRQFDDDLNSRIVPGETEPGLPGYALVSFHVSRPILRGTELFADVQNIFDQTVYVGTLPTTTGLPRTISVGLRLRYPTP